MADGKLVKLRERILLLNSKTIEDYSWLKQFLEENPNIKESELTTLPPDIQNFFNNMFRIILKQASEEWTSREIFPVDVLDGDKRIPCDLCHTNIKNICYITNKTNEKKLVVGSECVTHFGMNLGKPTTQLFKERIKTKRLEKLNNEFPGIARIMDTWNHNNEINRKDEEIGIQLREKLNQIALEDMMTIQSHLKLNKVEAEIINKCLVIGQTISKYDLIKYELQREDLLREKNLGEFNDQEFEEKNLESQRLLNDLHQKILEIIDNYFEK